MSSHDAKEGRYKRIAVLVQFEGFDYAAFLELTGQNRGFDLIAFGHGGDTLDWLVGDHEA